MSKKKKKTESTEEKKLNLEKAPEEATTLETAEEDTAEEVAVTEDTVEESVTEESEVSEESNSEESEEEETTEEQEEEDKKSEKSEKSEKTEKKAEKKSARNSRRSLKARAFKRGWFSIFLVILFIVAVVFLNLIATTLTEKIPALVIDTSGSDNFELTEETLDYLKTLDEDIRLIVLAEEKDFRNGGEYYIQANTLLHEYENKSDKISLEYVDMSSNPTFSSNYPDESLSYYGVIVQGENDYKYLTEADMFDVEMDYSTYSYYIAGSNVEEAVTSAILNVTLDEKPKVTFISDINGEDYSYFKNYLETNGFETDEMSPAMGVIPEDTSILVLFAPSVDLDSTNVDTISDFLNNDGNYGKQLIYLPSGSLTELPNIDSLLEEWGVQVEQGYAIENDTNYMAPFSVGYYLYAAQYTDSTYTANMKNSSLPFCVISGYAKTINILDTNNATSILALSDESQILYPSESDDENAEPVYENVPNAVIGAVATKSSTANTSDETGESTTETKSSNIVVIASSVSMSETLLKSKVYGNSTYILSVLNTLTGRGDVGVSIESKSLENAELGITSSQLYTLGALFTFVLPIAVLIAGIVIFIRRRNM